MSHVTLSLTNINVELSELQIVSNQRLSPSTFRNMETEFEDIMVPKLTSHTPFIHPLASLVSPTNLSALTPFSASQPFTSLAAP
jgi:hypothetical protein